MWSTKPRLMRRNASLGEHVDLDKLDKQISRIDHAYTTSTSTTRRTQSAERDLEEEEEDYDSNWTMSTDDEE
jgi:hypothetical protein